MPKVTKEELQKDLATVTEERNHLIREDRRVREVLSELLDSFEYTREYGYSEKTRTVRLLSWEAIAFKIGELAADANYSCVIAARERLKEEVQELKEEIYRLTHPEDKK